MLILIVCSGWENVDYYISQGELVDFDAQLCWEVVEARGLVIACSWVGPDRSRLDGSI